MGVMTETDHPGGRRLRAAAVSPERRRELIIESTLPLLIEQGAGVSTSRIARAAGIAEGTIFRAFKDKNELIAACVAAATRPDTVIDEIRALPAELPVRERLIAVAAAAGEHLNRVSQLIQTLRSADVEHRHGPGGISEDGPPGGGPREAMGRLTAALSTCLEPDSDALRLPPAQAAQMFFGLVFVNQMQGAMWGGEPLQPEQLVDLILGGLAASQGRRPKGPATARPTSAIPRRRSPR